MEEKLFNPKKKIYKEICFQLPLNVEILKIG